jgi:hypothetical protein
MNLQYAEKSFGLTVVEQPFWSSDDLVVLTVIASDPKMLCMWLVYCPGNTIGSIFLNMSSSETVTV